MHYQSAQAALASAKASGPQISAQEQAAVVPSVRAEVSYVQPNGSKPAILVGDGGEREEGGTRFVAREVEIANGRLTPEPHRLDRNGFEFVRQETRFTDFDDPEAIEQRYYPEMARSVILDAPAMARVSNDSARAYCPTCRQNSANLPR